MPNTANATWTGALKEGTGKVRLGQGAFEGNYSFKSRFEDGEGTNPEELIAAAEAGCFTMALSLSLGNAGHKPEQLNTSARVQLRPVDGKPTITKVAVKTEGRVPGIDQATFEEHARNAKEQCVVSRALGGVDEITVEATLAA